MTLDRCIVGDCRDVMRDLIVAGVKVQTCVTSPPYWGLRDYGAAGQIGLERDPVRYLARIRSVFRLVWNLLSDDGTLWLNLGDCYATGAGKVGGHPGGGQQGARWRGDVDRIRDQKRGYRGDRGGHEGKQSYRQGPQTQPNRMPIRGLKPKDLVGIPWRVAFALQADGWYLRNDIIWCLSGGVSVYARTQKGDMPMTIKDLVRLRPETVKLWNGQKWTQVLGWSRSIDTDGAIEIELRSGERIGCTRGHQWPTNRGLLFAHQLRVGDVIETTTLPEPDSVRDANALGDDVAWLCGLYLADGSMNKETVQLAGHADESAARLSRLERVAAAFHGTIRVHVEDGKAASICMDGPVIASVIRAYVHGDSAHTKGMKVRAWQRSNAWLRSFLEGYLAGDGHYDSSNDRWRLGFCRNDRLADDLRTLAARLNLSLRLSATTAKGFGREWPAYRGDIRLNPTIHHNARKCGEIVAVRASRARQFWDIGVEDEPHLFALASGVLTHNSKPNPMPESITDRCTKSHEYIFLLTKSERYRCDMDAIKEPAAFDTDGRYGRAHGGYEPPGQKPHNGILAPRVKRSGNIERKPRPGPAGDSRHQSGSVPWEGSTRNKRSVWTVPVRGFADAHFAVFPEALIEPCILAGSRPGDIVFDPFMGAGTVGAVASRLGRRWLGAEINPAYVEMQKPRTAQQGMPI